MRPSFILRLCTADDLADEVIVSGTSANAPVGFEATGHCADFLKWYHALAFSLSALLLSRHVLLSFSFERICFSPYRVLDIKCQPVCILRSELMHIQLPSLFLSTELWKREKTKQSKKKEKKRTVFQNPISLCCFVPSSLLKHSYISL